MTHPPKWSALAALTAAIGCQAVSPPEPAQDTRDISSFDGEHTGGRVHTQPIADFDPLIGPGVSALFEATRRRSGAELADLELGDFRVATTIPETTPGGSRLVHINMQQVVAGIPVEGSYLQMTARAGDGRGEARLVGSAYHVYAGLRVDTTPQIDAAQAHSRVRQQLGDGAAELSPARLVLWPTRAGNLELVYSIRADGSPLRYLVDAAGDQPGRVTRFDDELSASGHVLGHVAIGGAPGAGGVATLLPLPYVEVVGGDKTAVAGAGGDYAIDAPAGTPLSVHASGPLFDVDTSEGAAVVATADAGPGVDLVLGDPASEARTAEVTAYYYASVFRDFLAANGFDVAALPHLSLFTNASNVCNGGFSAGHVVLARAGSKRGVICNNTAEASVIIHEMGHWLDAALGGVINQGLSEGWGDLLACLTLERSAIGPDVFVHEGAPIRDCDNDYQYRGLDESHEYGKAWAGFGWDLRTELIEALGDDEGDALARALLLPTLMADVVLTPDAVRDVMLRDDDDGDITNGTPHLEQIHRAALAHSLGFVTGDDLVAPGAVTDLRVVAATRTTVTLAWTAPGDDVDQGVVTSYDLRRSDDPITESEYVALGEPAAVPSPVESGGTQELTLPIVPGQTHYFALHAIDELGNISSLSNVVHIDVDPAPALFDEPFEAGIAGWTASGQWHVIESGSTSTDAAVLYGNEASGNYDTGAATAGDLVSPEIDLTDVAHPLLVYATWFDVEPGGTFDVMTVTVADVADPSLAVSRTLPGGGSGGWLDQIMPLEAFVGRTVRITFHFDSIDAVSNLTTGWLIDDVRIFADADAALPRLVINEVLADPPPGFDASGDGVASAQQDEFIELVNIGDAAVDLSAARYLDKVGLRATFPPGTVVDPGAAVVLFGGGAPARIAGAVVVAGSGALYLNNAGDDIRIEDAGGNLLAHLSFGGVADQSIVRAADGDPDAPLVAHRSLAPAPASPGTRTGGIPFP